MHYEACCSLTEAQNLRYGHECAFVITFAAHSEEAAYSVGDEQDHERIDLATKRALRAILIDVSH
jgi:hypothetical protein